MFGWMVSRDVFLIVFPLSFVDSFCCCLGDLSRGQFFWAVRFPSGVGVVQLGFPFVQSVGVRFADCFPFPGG